MLLLLFRQFYVSLVSLHKYPLCTDLIFVLDKVKNWTFNSELKIRFFSTMLHFDV